MERLPEWLRLQLREPRTRQRLAIAIALLYFLMFVLAGPFTTGFGIVAAIPSALVFLYFRTNPRFALGLSGLGLLICLAAGVLSGGQGIVVTQASLLVTAFGALIAADRRTQQFGSGLLIAGALVTGIVSGSVSATVFVALLCLTSIAAAWAWRQSGAASEVQSQLAQSVEQKQEAERDVAVEQERNRIARDVHDVVAHSLAVVIAQADGARYAATANPESVGPALETIADTARGALGEVRVLLQNLRHEQGSAPTPGTADIDPLLDGMRDLGLTIETVTYGHERALGDATQLAVYRVVQEALTNALRHGDTTQPVGLDFDWGDHGVTIVITNTLRADGLPQLDGPGHGIPGMRERAALAGGELTVGVGNRGLFRVRATLPAPVAPTAATTTLPTAQLVPANG